MSSPIISIIVPVYNTEKYLRRCVDSIIAQTFTDWECLLIDDGSTDSSPMICDEYAKYDNRIKVFHQDNRGVSVARNKGIQYAKGEWITFIDSDDYLLEDYLYHSSILLQKYNSELGILWTNFVIKDDDNKYIKSYKISTAYCKSDDEMISVIQDNMLLRFVTCWAKFYSRSIIINNDIYFPMQICQNEDFCFLLDYLQKMRDTNKHFVLENIPLLTHTNNTNSLSQQKLDWSELTSLILKLNNSISSFNKRFKLSKPFSSELYRTLHKRILQQLIRATCYRQYLEVRTNLRSMICNVDPIDTRDRIKMFILLKSPSIIGYSILILYKIYKKSCHDSV